MSEKVDEKIVENLRQRFLMECQDNPSYYHELDVNRVRTDDWQVERYVLTTRSADEALIALIKAMRWKKAYGVHDRDDRYFPSEMYKLYDPEEFGRDEHNRIILWVTAKNIKRQKNPELKTLLEQFIAHETEKLDQKASRDGWIQISECSCVGLSNVDLDNNKFAADLLQCYYPRGLRLNIVVDMPFILNSVSKIALSFMNQELRNSVKFINKKALTDYVGVDLIPVGFGGNRNQAERKYPEGLTTIRQSPHLGLSDKHVNLFLNHYKDILNK